MATRSTNMLKTDDGTLIYKRHHSLPGSVDSDDLSGSTGTQSATAVRSSQRVVRSRYSFHAVTEDATNKTPDRKRPGESEASTLGSVPKRQRTIRTTASGQCIEWDAYCWLCHTEGNVSDCCCELCPRLYHKKCIGLKTVVDCWVCPECERVMKAENIDTRTKTLIDVDTLCVLLRYSIQRMKYPQSEPFFRPVDCALLPQYTDYVYHPMDFSTLERNIKKKAYGSTEAFVADVKWILHNSVIYNGKKHQLTTVARTVLKICRHETNEIEICPDCYKNSCAKPSGDWFCEPCHVPHKLVWAKMKGYPYWPAKVLQEENGQVDVRFFGEHDRAWLPVSQVYLISEQYPVTTKLRKGFDVATGELHRHVELLRERFGSFTYAAPRTPYVLQHNKLGVSSESSKDTRSPSASKLCRRQKKSAMKYVSSSVAGESGSHPAVKLIVKLSSASNKQPSVVSKTASALKLRYSSIISTRRGSAAATSKSDSLVKKSAVAMTPVCVKVPECVVNIERVRSSDIAGSAAAAVSCSDEVLTESDKPAADTSELFGSTPEQTEIPEHDHSLHSDGDAVIHTNNSSNLDTTDDGKENDSLNDTSIEDASQCEKQVLTDSNDGKQSDTVSEAVDDDVVQTQAEHPVVDDKVAADRSDNSIPVVAVDDDKLPVVSSVCSNSPAPHAVITTASNSDHIVADVSEKMSTSSAKNSDEGLMDVIEHSNLPSTVDVAKSEGKALSEYIPIASMSSDTSASLSIPSSDESDANAVNQSISLQMCCTSEDDMDRGVKSTADVVMAKEQNTVSNEKVTEEPVENLHLVSDSHSLSEGNCDSAADDANLIMDKADNRNDAEMECCDIAPANDVAGILSTGTDLERDSTVQENTSTVCRDSQPVPACIATTTELHPAVTASSLSCPTSRFPVVQFLTTQSKLSTGTAAVSHSSTSVSTSWTIASDNSTVNVSDSVLCPYASSTCLISPEYSPLSYSVAGTGLSLPCQLASHTVVSNSQDSAVSGSLCIDVNVCDVRPTCSISSATRAAAVSSGTSTATAAVTLHTSTCLTEPAVVVSDNSGKPITVSTFSSANIEKHARDNGDTTYRHLPALLDILQTPVAAMPAATETANSVSSSSVNELTTVGSPLQFSFAGFNFQKYTTMLQSATEQMLEQFCSDVVSGEVGLALRKQMQLEVNRLKWEHAQEIAEIRHNAAIALAEQKLTMEHLHRADVEELQNKLKAKETAYNELHKKLTHEKEVAVAETKKKQWCVNCGKEAIFYCCWNTSYCDYPCQLEHWPRHQLTCAQTVQNHVQTRDSSRHQTSAVRTSQPVNSTLDLSTGGGLRFAPVPRQSLMPTSALGGSSGPGIIMVRHNADVFRQQRPMLPSTSLFLPPRVLMP